MRRGGMPAQFRPEQQAQPEHPQRTTRNHVASDFLLEENPRIQRVPQRGSRKHHRNQPRGDPLAGGQKAHKVDAKQAQPLGQANQMSAPVHHLQLAAEQQHGKQYQRRQAEAVNDGHRNRHHSQLQFEGNPGGAPDQDSHHIQEQVHGALQTMAFSLGLLRCAHLQILALLLARGWQPQCDGVGCEHARIRYPASLPVHEQLAQCPSGAQCRTG